jgi:predicted LPLAT superfamily acyltransferase
MTTGPVWTSQPERGSPWLLKLMAWAALHFGRGFALLLIWPIALFFWLRTPSQRRHSAEYLRRVLAKKVGWRDTFAHYRSFSTAILDRVFFLSDRYDLYDIDVAGLHHLENTITLGRGGFLLGAHLGSFEALRAVARTRKDAPVCIAMFEDAARKINAFVRALNPNAATDIIALGRPDSMLAIQERLARGQLVGMLADRSLGEDKMQAVPFLGDLAKFPIGVFRMAAALHVPVIFMSGLHLGGNRYRLSFEPLADFSDTPRAEREIAVTNAVRSYASAIEDACRLAPMKWFNFYDFWTP